jgi:hypothetical protein
VLKKFEKWLPQSEVSSYCEIAEFWIKYLQIPLGCSGNFSGDLQNSVQATMDVSSFTNAQGANFS